MSLEPILSFSCPVFSPLCHICGLALLVAIVRLGWETFVGWPLGGWGILWLCLGLLFSS